MAVRAVAVLLALATATMAADRSSALQRLVNSSERVVQARLRVDRTEKLCMQRSDSVAVNLVVTYVDVEPTDYVTGESGDRPTLRLLGGFWGGYAFLDTEAPDIQNGQEALLFLSESETAGSDGKAVFYLPHGREGKLDIEWWEGRKVAVVPEEAHNLGLEPDGQAIGDGWIDLDSVKQMIQEAEARRSAANARPRATSATTHH